MGGEFYLDSALYVKELSEEEKVQVLGAVEEQLSGYGIVKVYSYEIEQSSPLRGKVSLHVKNEPESASSIAVMSDGKISEDGIMQASAEGSYLAVKTTLGNKGYIIVMDKTNHYIAVFMTILVIVIVAVMVIFLWNKKHRTAKIFEDKGQETEGLTDSSVD